MLWVRPSKKFSYALVALRQKLVQGRAAGKGSFLNLAWVPFLVFLKKWLYDMVGLCRFCTFFKKSCKNFGFWLKINKSINWQNFSLKSKPYKGPFFNLQRHVPVGCPRLSKCFLHLFEKYISYFYTGTRQTAQKWKRKSCCKKILKQILSHMPKKSLQLESWLCQCMFSLFSSTSKKICSK